MSGLAAGLLRAGSAAWDEVKSDRRSQSFLMPTQTLKKNDPAKARAYFEERMAFTVTPLDLDAQLDDGEVNVIDVRSADDYDRGHIPGAVNLPRERWGARDCLMQDKVNVIYGYSQTCRLAAAAAFEFAGAGFSVVELTGGFAAWKGPGLRIER